MCQHEDFPCCGCDPNEIQQFDASDICDGCGEPYQFCRCDEYDDDDEDERYERDLDDSMDGDFDTAMRDAGLGTDEDYGYFGGFDER